MSATATTALAPVPVTRRRRTESPDETLARYRASGLTQRAFCEQIGLPLSTLQWWLVRARRRALTARPVTFTEIPLAIAPPPSAPAWAVEIVTATGVTVRLREPLPPTAVRTLVRGGRC
jgi:hypothetical protein